MIHIQQTQVGRKQSRYSKGAVIAVSRRILKLNSDEAWLVESETADGKYYKVTSEGDVNVQITSIEVRFANTRTL